MRHHFTSEEWEAKSEEERDAELLILEGDCWNHLRNVWIKAMSNGITTGLMQIKILDVITKHLRRFKYLQDGEHIPKPLDTFDDVSHR